MKREPRMIMKPPMIVVGIMTISTAARGPKAWSRPAERTAPPVAPKKKR